MSFKFLDKEIKEIVDLLEQEPKQIDDTTFIWEIINPSARQSLTLTIYNDVDLAGDNGVLISVQTLYGVFELHNCINYLRFEPDELIFVATNDNKLNVMTVGKNCSLSLYSNINRELLERDFSELDSATLLSAMQASLVEDILPNK